MARTTNVVVAVTMVTMWFQNMLELLEEFVTVAVAKSMNVVVTVAVDL